MSVILVVVVVILVVLVLVFILTGKKDNKVKQNDEITMQQFNLSELSKFDGKNDPLVYLACKNTIFDVSNSEHYKPTGSYGIFAGKDCSISLAKMSFDESFLNSSNHFTLNSKEKETLDQWYDKFKEKYPVVGILKPN